MVKGILIAACAVVLCSGQNSAVTGLAFLVPAVPSWECGPAKDGQDAEAVEADGEVHRWVCKFWAGHWQWVEVDRFGPPYYLRKR